MLFWFPACKKNAKFFLGIEVNSAPLIDGNIKEGDEIMIESDKLTVIETPGHTPGSICLYSETENILFTGDTLFANGRVGRTDFSYSSTNNLKTSLQKIYKLPKDTIIYPGHGEVSTLTPVG